MFRFLTAGESHGPALGVIVEGLPAGLGVRKKVIEDELARRRLGFGRGPRMKFEKDRLELLSGVRFGKTIGAPILMVIHNTEWSKWERVMAAEGEASGNVLTEPRPGHADLAGMLKYGLRDARDVLERASARETAARTAAGALAKILLAELGVTFVSHVTAIGTVVADPSLRPAAHDLEAIDASSVRTFDQAAEERMVAEIESAADEGDSLGGAFEVISYGVPPGLGSHVHWDRRLDGRLAAAVMSIPGIKGVEIGDGFSISSVRGTKAHDEIFYTDGEFVRQTDRAGGVEGGMSIGGSLRIRAAMKPLSTLKSALQTVDVVTKNPAKAFRERTDVCSVPAAAVVGEAMTAIVLAECVVEKFGGDSLADMTAALDAYLRRTRI